MGLIFSTLSTVAAVVFAYTLWLSGRSNVSFPPGEERYFVRAPKFYWYVALLNEFGYLLRSLFGYKVLPISPDEMIKLVRSAPKSDLFGPQDELEKGVLIGVTDIQNAPTSPVGRVILRFMIPRLLMVRAHTMKYVIDHPEIAKTQIKAPIIVLGLPRTGSTLMHHLLAQDPNTRSPNFWEMWHSEFTMPPSTKEEWATHPRRKLVQQRLTALDNLAPGMIAEMSKSHVMDAEQVDEELIVMMQQFILGNFITLCGKSNYAEWMFKKEKQFAYTYLLRYLQALQTAYPPKTHWTLKTPAHALYIKSLFDTFPDARIVITHRDITATIPSVCKYFESMSTYFLEDGKLDRRAFGQVILRMTELMTEQMKLIRQTKPKEQFFDVKYEVFIKDPIATIKKIYEHYGMEYTLEFEQNMRKYIQDHPQGKHGRAHYDTLDYGLEPQVLQEKFKEYSETFLS